MVILFFYVYRHRLIFTCLLSLPLSSYAGAVQLMKGSIASSYRESRNAKKRSFEQSMSATAAKILKMEQEKGEGTIEEVRGDKRE